ncbi:MAG TPA: hypothetical protein VHQ65_12235 [Thermoanaerobaculia bacterium]|nr:hypothetical protein [Thermoanaerobaculia bacterium]
MSKKAFLAVLCALSVPATTLVAEQVVWTEDGVIYEQEVPTGTAEMERIVAAATTAGSVYTAAVITNTSTTGHGNVQFQVLWNSSTGKYQILVWSYNSPYGCVGYRQWFQEPAGVFGSWPRSGGAACVGWPPSTLYPGINNSMQIIDVDADGDLDVFQLVETSSSNWTVYLYKNSN